MAELHTSDRVILNRYRLGSIVGRGGAASVYRAEDLQTGETVAVKAIPADAEMARRAGAEIRANTRLSHPGIVELHDFGADDEACYIVSELIEGTSLRDDSRRTPPPAPARLVGAVADVLDGLDHAHAQGVTHRDVKPANILIDRDGRGHLTDFGIARIAGEAGLTTVGGLVGTVSYMAPEQAQGKPTGPAADVYSACLVLYECLSGTNPLVGSTSGETLRRAAAGEVPPLRQALPGLNPKLASAIDAGLHPDPRRRPAPAALAATLRANLPARSTATPGPAASPWLSRAVAAAAAGALAASVVDRWTDLPTSGVAAAATVAGAGAAFAPWTTALVGWLAASVALARMAPAIGVLIGALGLVALAPLRRRGRLALLPATAPFLMALGLIPVYVVAAGLLRTAKWRLWAALTGMGAALGWSALAGADPSIDGGRVLGAWANLEDVVSPVRALDVIAEPFRTRPSLAVAAGLLALATLFVPVLLRLRFGVPRVVGAIVWLAALIVAVRLTGGSLENALGAFVPGGILVAVWAAVGGRRLTRDADRQKTVTIGNSVERLPAA